MTIKSEKWSDASGNQKVLEQCLEHFRTATQPAESQTASQATPSAPEREVLLLAAPAGTGATALLLHLASLLSLEGQNVLSVLGGTTLEPTDFRHALSIAAGMPGELATKVDSVMTELGQVQHAVLNARNYETSIVHDVQNYLKGSKEANTNFWIMSHWVKSFRQKGFLFCGLPDAISTLSASFKTASIKHRIFTLEPMVGGPGFDQFLADVKAGLVDRYAPDVLVAVDTTVVHERSGGRIGAAVDVMDHLLMEMTASIDTVGEPDWYCLDAHEVSQERRYEPDHVQVPIQELVTPVLDETFSSWAARSSLVPRNSADSLFAENFMLLCSKGSVDPDRQYANLELLSHFSPRERLLISKQFKETDDALVAYPNALNYCPQCFHADLCAGLNPVWRLVWQKSRSCVCVNHEGGVMLQRLETRNFTVLNKAWVAFKEHVQSPAARLTSSFPLQHSNPEFVSADNSCLVHLTERVQFWFYSLSETSTPTRRAAEFLLAFWLQDSDESKTQGFARSYFFYRLTKPHAGLKKKLHGEVRDSLRPDSAKPRDLAVAYWMLGVSFELISDVEAVFIRDTTRAYSTPFPVNRSEIATLGTLAYSWSQISAYLRHARVIFDEKDLKAVAWAIDETIFPASRRK
ncbi:TniQ family protein [Pseudomonas syringae]|uniref:TniQ family protein n=1 Tax=Pseudomonas syringae pv. papulans TaxID=83963 RepID=A0A0P9XT60_PSESX|nr:TniQ family protein [Pseudomonas syringae]KPY29486.1 hypothetical protein ALO65_05539 [Pseudomonas syringae pv. papulans]KWS42665.1 hypothetical protein AL059_18320 [Pseudomonas syringae pv. papulans]MDH4601325.1 TniQ family protein [Pseudomonas syringae pv. papulans]MDH4622960.1 TniQ family protein [Pseudomonas syringae pv. papulans]RMN39035.1 hypothetical protein ALQ60_03160 [Pseudomonas syringae pv. papulans]